MPSVAPAAAVSDEVELGVLNDAIGFRLRRLHNHVARGFAAHLATLDLRSGMFSALALVDANPGISQTALSKEIGLDKATVVAIVDSLEGLGWATRRQSRSDRRRRELTTTPQGRAALKDLQQACLANEAPIYAGLSEAERRSLFALLDKAYAAYISDV